MVRYFEPAIAIWREEDRKRKFSNVYPDQAEEEEEESSDSNDALERREPQRLGKNADLHPADARFDRLQDPGEDPDAEFPPHRGWPVVGFHNVKKSLDRQPEADRTDAEDAEDVDASAAVQSVHDRSKQDNASGARRRDQQILKRQHFHVLNTILYKCLLSGDYTRARRAMGLMMRFDVGGFRMDMRKKGLWMTAAEILLHQPVEAASSREMEGDSPPVPPTVEEGSTDTIQKDDFSAWLIPKQAPNPPPPDDNFASTLRFLERMILQYPYNKRLTHNVSAKTIYPALIALSVTRALSHSARARAEFAQSERATAGGASSDEHENYIGISPHPYREHAAQPPSSPARSDHERDLLRTELSAAEALYARIGTIDAQPPYDRDTTLLRMEREIAQWALRVLDALRDEGGEEADSERRTWERAARTVARRLDDLGLVEEDGGGRGGEKRRRYGSHDSDGDMDVDMPDEQDDGLDDSGSEGAREEDVDRMSENE